VPIVPQKEITMRHLFRVTELELTAILVGFAICLSGCSSSYTVSAAGKPNSEYSYQEVNEMFHGRHATVEMKNGEELSAEAVIVSNDTVSWLNGDTSEKSQSAIQLVKRISYNDHVVGGLEGLGITFPVVFVGSWGLGGFSSKGIGGSDGAALPMALGLIGGGVGMITGAIIGHSYTYELHAAEQSDSLQNR
jgi:hypothetical protein